MKKKSTAANTGVAGPTVIRMTKIKQWYIVADLDAYKALKSVGTPMIRVHQNFLPTLGLLTNKAGIKIKNVDFEKEILDPFLTKTTETWGRKYGKVQMTSKVLVFTAQATKGVDPLHDEKLVAAKDAINKLEGLLVSFFARWGYRSTVQYSEAAGGSKVKLHVEYWFDNDKMPILPTETPAQELKEVVIKLGFARLTLSMDDRLGDIARIAAKARKAAPDDPAVKAALEKCVKEEKTTAETAEVINQTMDRLVETAVHEARSKTKTDVDYINVKFEVSQGGTWNSIHTSKCLASQVSDVLPMVNALMSIVNIDPHNADNEAK